MFCRGDVIIYLLLYVNIVLAASSAALLLHNITALQQEFSIEGMGELHRFLRMQVHRRAHSLFLS